MAVLRECDKESESGFLCAEFKMIFVLFLKLPLEIYYLMTKHIHPAQSLHPALFRVLQLHYPLDPNVFVYI